MKAIPQHIFFSWQIDRLPLTGRNLIQRALGDAILAIQADAEIFDILWQTSGWGDGSPSFGRDIWDGYAGADDGAAR